MSPSPRRSYHYYKFPSPSGGEGLAKARNLRQRMTSQEQKLWKQLRNRGFKLVKFHRQAPLGPYIVDFCSFEQKMIIELDGGHHLDNIQIAIDRQRDEYFENQGYVVLRFWNYDIDLYIEKVLQKIEASLSPRGRGIVVKEYDTGRVRG